MPKQWQNFKLVAWPIHIDFFLFTNNVSRCPIGSFFPNLLIYSFKKQLLSVYSVLVVGYCFHLHSGNIFLELNFKASLQLFVHCPPFFSLLRSSRVIWILKQISGVNWPVAMIHGQSSHPLGPGVAVDIPGPPHKRPCGFLGRAESLSHLFLNFAELSFCKIESSLDHALTNFVYQRFPQTEVLWNYIGPKKES